jgi:hypothetical protein
MAAQHDISISPKSDPSRLYIFGLQVRLLIDPSFEARFAPAELRDVIDGRRKPSDELLTALYPPDPDVVKGFAALGIRPPAPGTSPARRFEFLEDVARSLATPPRFPLSGADQDAIANGKPIAEDDEEELGPGLYLFGMLETVSWWADVAASIAGACGDKRGSRKRKTLHLLDQVLTAYGAALAQSVRFRTSPLDLAPAVRLRGAQEDTAEQSSHLLEDQQG